MCLNPASSFYGAPDEKDDMWPYWLLFIVPTYMALSRPRPVAVRDERWSTQWWGAFVLLVLMVGLRHEVGGDWMTYLWKVELARISPLSDALAASDPAYGLLNWLAARLSLGPYFVNTVCAGIFAWGLIAFCRSQPRPWLAMVVAIPYLVTVVAMGYTRQATAIGLAMLAIVALERQRIRVFVAYILLAALFHKSAVILMPLAALRANRKRIWTALWVVGASVLFYVLLLQDSLDALKYGYLDAEYQSEGAGIRVAMNALPAGFLLALRRRFSLSEADRLFWARMSWAAIGFIPLLYISPSSTAVDRMALYWMPLQLLVWSRLPDALGRRGQKNILLVSGVVAYSATVLFTWLVFAKTAFAWIPYQFYPWVLLWQ